MARRRKLQKASELADDAMTTLPMVVPKERQSDGRRLNKYQRDRIVDARRERVSYYLMLGWTEVKIAQELDVSPSTVHYDIEAIRLLWQQRTVDNVAQAAVVDLARLDFIIASLLPQIQAGDTKAADAATRAIADRANILGYKMGLQVDITNYLQEVAAANGFDPVKAIEFAQRMTIQLK